MNDNSETVYSVKWFSPGKGHGFIVPDQGAAEVFVHHAEIVTDERWRTLVHDDRVGNYGG